MKDSVEYWQDEEEKIVRQLSRLDSEWKKQVNSFFSLSPSPPPHLPPFSALFP